MLATRDRAKPANLYRAAFADDWAALRSADRLFKCLSVDDRVPAERQRGTCFAGRAAVAEHSVAGIDKGFAWGNQFLINPDLIGQLSALTLVGWRAVGHSTFSLGTGSPSEPSTPLSGQAKSHPPIGRRLDSRGRRAMTEALRSWGSYDVSNPFPLFAEVRTLGAVHRTTLPDGHEAWLVVRYEEAMAALGDQRLSKDMHAALASGSDVVAEGLPGPEFARHMLTVDPPDHTRLRRLVSAAFSPRRVEALRPQVQTITDDLLDDVAAHGPEHRVDLVATFSFPLPFTVICELLGVPHPTRPALGRAFTKLLVPTSTAAEYAEAKGASDVVVGMLRDLVAAKERNPGEDLVSALISARDGDERLSSQELLSTIFQLMVAGHDTTASLIGNSVVALLRNPVQMSKLRGDLSKLPNAVEEFLRYDAPVPHSTFRFTASPVTIGDVPIPAGAQVIICMASANRDGDKFENPESLDIDRAVTRHLAFGHGVHHCLGAPLARLEGGVALESLLRRFPQLRLAVPSEDLRWNHGDGLVLRGLSELPVLPGPALPRRDAAESLHGASR